MPSARAMKGYSNCRYPEIPDTEGLIDSVVLTLYCSKEEGSDSLGACTKVRLPVPAMRTVQVAPELAAKCSVGKSVSMVNEPTAPLKLDELRPATA